MNKNNTLYDELFSENTPETVSDYCFTHTIKVEQKANDIREIRIGNLKFTAPDTVITIRSTTSDEYRPSFAGNTVRYIMDD